MKNNIKDDFEIYHNLVMKCFPDAEPNERLKAVLSLMEQEQRAIDGEFVRENHRRSNPSWLETPEEAKRRRERTLADIQGRPFRDGADG